LFSKGKECEQKTPVLFFQSRKLISGLNPNGKGKKM